MTLLSILLLVVVLAVVCRVAASAARVGLTLLAVFLVLLCGVAVWRLSAMPVAGAHGVFRRVGADRSRSGRRRPPRRPLRRRPKRNCSPRSPTRPPFRWGARPAKSRSPRVPLGWTATPCRSATRTKCPSRPVPRKNWPNARRPWIVQLKKAVAAYIDEYFGPEAAGNVSRIRHHQVRLGLHQEALGEARKHLRGKAADVVRADVPDARAAGVRAGVPQRAGRIDEAIWNGYAREVAIAFRLRGLALGFGAVLCLLTVVFGYLRLDTATRGYYTGRLQFLAATAILIVIVAGALLASRVMWM